MKEKCNSFLINSLLTGKEKLKDYITKSLKMHSVTSCVMFRWGKWFHMAFLFKTQLSLHNCILQQCLLGCFGINNNIIMLIPGHLILVRNHNYYVEIIPLVMLGAFHLTQNFRMGLMELCWVIVKLRVLRGYASNKTSIMIIILKLQTETNGE